MTLIQKYTLVSALCVLALVLGLGTVISRHLGATMLERDVHLTAAFVQAQVREHLSPADFAAGAAAPFAAVFREMAKMHEVLQVNVFDPRGTIVWSSDPSLVGRRFPEKRDLQQALAGRLVAEVAGGKPEQLKGPGVPSPLVELYIPIAFEGGPVVGVLETYKAPALLEHVRHAVWLTWGLVALGGGLLYLSLFWLVRRVWVSHVASERSLEERNRELTLLNSRLETLGHLNRAVLSTLEPAEVFKLVVESAVRLLPAVSVAHLWLLDEEGETLSLAAAEPAARPGPPSLGLRDSLIGRVMTSGQADACPDVLQDPRWKDVEWACQEGLRSHAGAPIGSDQRLVGGLSVLTRQAHAFSGEELGLLASLATSAATAIENARLFAEVRRARTQWQATVDGIGDPVILVNPRYEVLRVNGPGAASVGRTPEELVGRSCCQAFCGREAPDGDCPVTRAFRSGRAASRERLDGGSGGRTIQVEAYPITVGQGVIDAVVEYRRDITEAKESQERLIQMEKLRALGELAGGVAHDFNNLLAVILGRVDLMLQRGRFEAEDARRSLGAIRRAALDGAAMVRRIQDFARLQRATTLDPLDLNVAVRDAVELTRPRWADETQARGMEVAVDLQLGEIPPVAGNAVEVREVLTNIILNAVDALPRGGRISVKTWLQDPHVCVAVADTGTGMSEEVRRRVFDPFFTTKGTRGTGLGLSVAYGIVQRHGGEISVESAPGQGSTFIVRLPVASRAPAAAPAPPPEGGRAGRVLLIDDEEEEVLAALAEMLAGAGHRVSTARSGEAGVAAFREGEFDLVLSDLGMPGMSGWEVVEELRAVRPEIPVVLVTGWGEQLDPERLGRSGVARTVAKPVEMGTLLRAVSEVLDGAGGQPL